MILRHILLLSPAAPSCPEQVIVVKSRVIFRDGSVTTGFSTQTEKCHEDLVTDGSIWFRHYSPPQAKYARRTQGYMTYPDSSNTV